jgi:hypothetical protein
MQINVMRAAKKALMLTVLTAASFWLFACQARAGSLPVETSDPLLLLFMTGFALLGLAYGAQVLRVRTITQGRL